MTIHEKSRYREVHAQSLADPEAFWGEVAKEIDWIEPAKKIFDPSQGLYGRWFAGAKVNTCYNALDRHVEGGRAEQTALIYDSPVTDTIKSFTYRELRDLTARFAGALASAPFFGGASFARTPSTPPSVSQVGAFGVGGSSSIVTSFTCTSALPPPSHFSRQRAIRGSRWFRTAWARA